MRDLIRQAQEEGLADASVDAGMLANCVFATVIWPYRWFHAGSKDTPESIADTCTAFVSRGLMGGFAAGREASRARSRSSRAPPRASGARPRALRGRGRGGRVRRPARAGGARRLPGARRRRHRRGVDRGRGGGDDRAASAASTCSTRTPACPARARSTRPRWPSGGGCSTSTSPASSCPPAPCCPRCSSAARARSCCRPAWAASRACAGSRPTRRPRAASRRSRSRWPRTTPSTASA